MCTAQDQHDSPPPQNENVRFEQSRNVRLPKGRGRPMEKERIELSARERERLKVLHEVEQGHLRQVEAAQRLRISDHQVRRLQQRLRTVGDRRLANRSRLPFPL
jgi:hypothetical protein